MAAVPKVSGTCVRGGVSSAKSGQLGWVLQATCLGFIGFRVQSCEENSLNPTSMNGNENENYYHGFYRDYYKDPEPHKDVE